MFVIMLVLLALVAGDKLAYLQFLDAELFATDLFAPGFGDLSGRLPGAFRVAKRMQN